jgi:signal transduction histidine kinase
MLDITRTRQKRADMESMGLVMSQLAHQLKNNITVIRSSSQFCLEWEDLPTPIKENLSIILQRVQKIDKILNDLLNSTTPTTPLLLSSIDINKLITQVWKIAELTSLKKRVALVMKLDPEIPPIMGDEERLEEVFLNLFLNAVQAVTPKGKIMVQSRPIPSKNLVEINIIDNGPGIAKNQRDKIFAPFFTTKKEGMGLGLSISLKNVHHHNGNIYVQHGKGGGTKFSVRLPVTQPQR